jgi:hypothetical protein
MCFLNRLTSDAKSLYTRNAEDCIVCLSVFAGFNECEVYSRKTISHYSND